MKKGLISLQVILMYILVSFNLTPSIVNAQETMQYSQITDVISIGQNISDNIQGKEKDIYLLTSTGEEVTLSIDAMLTEPAEEGTFTDIQWKVLQVNYEEGDTEIIYNSEENIVVDNILFTENAYSYETTLELEQSYYLIIFEGMTEQGFYEYNFELDSNISYATSLSIPSSKIMLKGKSETLKVSKVQPSGAELGITWSSTKPSIAKVNAKTGKVTALKYGIAYIKAELQNGKVYKCKVSVENPKISKSSVVLIKGNKRQISVSQNFNKVSFSSSNKSVAVVTSKGIITAKGKGTAKITAKIGTKKLVCTVKVEVPKISISKVQLTAGKTQTLKVTGTSQKVSWKSSNTSVATVNSNGKVTTKSAGSTKISASVGGKTIASCYVVVKAKKTTSSSVRSETVYITRTGEKYHRYGCRYLRQSCIAISLRDALAYGYDDCSVCY